MNLRELLLAHLQDPHYKPANEFELSSRLGLNKKQRAMLAHEVRLALKSGNYLRAANGRISPRGANVEEPRAPEKRPVFTPTRRGPGFPVTPTPETYASRPTTRGATIPPRASTPAKSPASAASPAPSRTPARAPARAPSPGPARAPKAVTEPKLGKGELVGRIQFRAGGSAFVVRDAVLGEDAQPALQVFPEDTGVALPGDRVLAREFPGRKGRRPGEKIGAVIRVLARERDTIVGNLRKGRREFVVQPDDPRFSYEIAVGDPAKSGLSPVPKEGDKVVIKLGEWNHRADALTGTITSRLGRTHEPRAELLGIFLKHNLATEFPSDVEREAALIPDRVLPSELPGRLDYRAKVVFTIDPDDAKDFDDALSYEPLDGGEVRVGIHIADVSTYVHPGTAIDREAQRRGNSTYLVGVVIPMLPEKLSNGLCSLVEAQDRLCKAVFLTFAKNGRLRDTTYANTVIRSRKRLTYKQAYAFMFEDDLAKIRALPLPAKHQTGSTGRALRDLTDAELHDLQTWCRALWKIAARLRKDRMANGSLDLDMPETKIFVDEKGYADRLEKITHDESHQLIEEFMLAANEAVARLTRTHQLPSLYRVHDEPDAEKLEEFRGLLDSFDIPVGDLSVRAEIVKLLVILAAHPQGYTLRTQLLRSLKKAAYRATPDGHYGLAKNDYTHFTSPIRRYADLVVHRVFDTYLEKHAGHAIPPARNARYDLSRIQALGEHISLTEISSAEAERESVKIKLLEFFERELDKSPRTPFLAVITDVRPNGFFIELVESMTFGFISTNALTPDRYVPTDDGTMLVGRKTKKKFALNGRLNVVVDKVDRFKRLIDFRPAD
ncbi:MAG: RNB domain-containing ribonuclease [Verrucomicrobia bacterium]|nr:RNB domain-containing ribonuclease [Verrucomicrobiota bacterium]